MPNLLIIKHVENEGPGTIARFFEDAAWDLRAIELGGGDRLPASLEGINAVIRMGAQILAKAGGAKIKRSPVNEIGWREDTFDIPMTYFFISPCSNFRH